MEERDEREGGWRISISQLTPLAVPPRYSYDRIRELLEQMATPYIYDSLAQLRNSALLIPRAGIACPGQYPI